ncbi:Putative sortase-sorted surface protein (fragment) [Paraburkholderia piptadeniae]|uniref:Sortase-sorted surface protein n=2 Tax=Paraburkholderia piptadeniae TaxID=1701573 RepID=A0A1N7SRD2_9BURK
MILESCCRRTGMAAVVAVAMVFSLAGCGGDSGADIADAASAATAKSAALAAVSSSAPDPEPLIDMTGVRNTGAGSARIGTAAYAVPSGAVIYVSPNGSDTAAGTLAAPLATIQQAITKASAGATIVLREGSYHEHITTNRQVTIQAYPRETVWLEGSSVVSAWMRTTSASKYVWAASWNHVFRHDPTFTVGAADGTGSNQFVNANYPMAAHPDQVWVDGVTQTQVASLGQVTPGSFFYDETGAKLYLGADPTGHVVRASDVQVAITDNSTGSTFQGFGVRRYAPSVPNMGAVQLLGSGVTFRNVAVLDNATTGLFIGNANATVQNVTVARNGLLGVGGNRTDGLRMQGLLAVANNQEHFNMSPVAAGFKTSHSRNVTVSDSVFLRNLSTGLWFDESSYDIKILNNDSIGNAGHGLDTEISDKAQFVNNLVVSNGGSGIKVINTSDVDIWNNTLAKNSTTTSERNLNIVMDTRRWATATSSSQKDLRQGVATPPDMTWITGPTNVHNNVITGGSGNCLMCVEDYSFQYTAAQLKTTTDNNVYQRSSVNTPTWVAVWSRGQIKNPAVYTTLRAFASDTGQEMHGYFLDGPAALDASYRLTPAVSSAVNTVSAPLPPDIAMLIQKPAGIRALGVWW